MKKFNILHRLRRATAWSTLALAGGVVLAAAAAVGGCDKREYYRSSTVPVFFKPDWSAAAAQTVPSQVTLLIYNQAGAMVEEHVISAEGETLDLAQGTYSVICLNETENVEVKDKENFGLAAVVARTVTKKVAGGVSSKADGVVIQAPGYVYLHSKTGIPVEGVAYVAHNSKAEGADTALVSLPMKKIVKLVDFTFDLDGFSAGDVELAQGTLSGVASTVNLATGEIVAGGGGTCEFPLTDDGQGRLQGTLVIFGSEAELEGSEVKNEFDLQIDLKNGDTAGLGGPEDITDDLSNGGGDLGEIHKTGTVQVQPGGGPGPDPGDGEEAGLITIVIDWVVGGGEDLDGK